MGRVLGCGRSAYITKVKHKRSHSCGVVEINKESSVHIPDAPLSPIEPEPVMLSQAMPSQHGNAWLNVKMAGRIYDMMRFLLRWS